MTRTRKRRFVGRMTGNSLGGGYGAYEIVPFRWWNPSHWFAPREHER